MCGIIYAKSKKNKPVRKTIAQLYEKQKDRGQRGFGFIEIGAKSISLKRNTEEKGILLELKKSNAREILFHHREPTSTPNFLEATHPLNVENDALKFNYYVIHNGIISNSEKLRENHLQLGFTYNTELKQQWITKQRIYETTISFNDSEALAIEIALFLEEKIEKISAEGSMAFIVLQTDKKGKPQNLFFARNNQNPLNLFVNKKGIIISSEGHGKKIKKSALYSYNYNTQKITNKKIALYEPIEIYRDSLNWNNYRYEREDWEDDDIPAYDLYELENEISLKKEMLIDYKDEPEILELLEEEIREMQQNYEKLETQLLLSSN